MDGSTSASEGVPWRHAQAREGEAAAGCRRRGAASAVRRRGAVAPADRRPAPRASPRARAAALRGLRRAARGVLAARARAAGPAILGLVSDEIDLVASA